MHHDAECASTPVFRLLDPAATAAVGAALFALVERGDAVCLTGPLGAGKTTLARGLLQAALGGVDVPSPTFTLVEVYETPAFPIAHFDLYRLEDPEEIDELGLDEALESGVCRIEWPERAAGRLPRALIVVALEPDDRDARRVRIRAPRARIDRFAAALRSVAAPIKDCND
ncbi:MAG: tRNA (adenosine(37)-N6)-threonylcarbamoyltransferase complex ATPase subunit type 1 TsaE [Pseudomonadota bacterium]